MGNVVTLPDRTPPARYDGNAWTTTLISEAAAAAGPYATIATIGASPPDSDPTNPRARNFTTSNAALTAGWYQLTWQDASAGQWVDTPVPYPPPADQAYPSYCSVFDVQSRNAARPVTASSTPNLAQVQQFVIDAAAELNAILINKQYAVPIYSASSPNAFAVLHSMNVTGGWAKMEQSAPTSPNVDRASVAWEKAKEMLADAKFVLSDAPQDMSRAEPRGPWVTAQPTGHHFDPMFSDGYGGRDSNRRDPYMTRNMRF